jgi:hypothetical protein
MRKRVQQALNAIVSLSLIPSLSSCQTSLYVRIILFLFRFDLLFSSGGVRRLLTIMVNGDNRCRNDLSSCADDKD